jgi:multiple sugar transport system permease protein
MSSKLVGRAAVDPQIGEPLSRRRHRARSRWHRSVMTSVILLPILFPVYWMIVTSLSPTSQTLSRSPDLLPSLSLLSLDAYSEIFDRRPFDKWLLNSTIVTLGSVLTGVAIAALAAYALSRYDFRATKAVGFSLLLSRAVPATLIVIPIFIRYSNLNWLNTYHGLIFVNVATIVPSATWLLRAYFDTIPRSIEGAARIDGCGTMGVLRKIILPLSWPGLAASAAFGLTIAWSEFLYARTLVTKDGLWTATVGLASFIGEHQIRWQQLMAASLVTALPLIFAYAYLERHLVGGLASGAVR